MAWAVNGCYRCGSPDHWADSCPHNARAATRREHETRIAGYVGMYISGEIAQHEKQRMIQAENELWYGENMPPGLRR